ncbi:hypothetical protein C8R44DRAFT_630501, partial [Mycena epipterygia]
CFPHVINIVTQTILVELKENPCAVLGSASNLTFGELVSYVDALKSNPVSHGRQIVAVCRASGQHRSDLKVVITQGKEKKIRPPNKTLRAIQLLRDCETRWFSMYLMSERVMELYPAIQCFLKHPQQDSLSHLLFIQEQYQVLTDIQLILSIPHAAQELLSVEKKKTPTLLMALPAFELLLESWLNLQTELPELAHYIGVGIAKIQEYMNKGHKS